MKKIISLLIILVIYFVTGTEASSGRTEQWELILDGGQGSGNCTLIENQGGTVTADGDWVYTYQGADVSGPYSDASVTIEGSSISLTASGTATNPSAPSGYRTSPFTLNISGTAYNGQGSGTFELTFTTFGWPPSISGSWEGTRTSGSGITAELKAMPCLPLLLLMLSDLDNVAPVANAGMDQNVTTGSLLNLDGSDSNDPDGDTLTYSWSFLSIPGDSSATLLYSTSVSPSFTADVEGTYEISLVVNDGKVDSAADQVTVVARKYDTLNYILSDAEYSKQLDKIITVSSSPKQLHIYNPETEENEDIDLPLTPACLSVSPDGLYAAVGHDGWISYVNLTTAVLEKTFSVTTDVLDIVLAGNGYVYAFPRQDQWERIRCVEIATEIETLHTGYSIRAGTLAKLHPNSDAIYGADNGLSPSDIEKYSVVNGTAEYLYDSPYHGDFSMCGDLWISEDGLRIFTRCGNVFRSSDLQSQDMTYNGSLSELNLVEHLSHSSSASKVIAIPEADWSPPDDEDTELQIYDYSFLNFEESVSLPKIWVNGNAYPEHGKYVFFNSDGSAYYVVMRADETSGMLYDFGVVTLYP